MEKGHGFFLAALFLISFTVLTGRASALGYSPHNQWALVAVVPGVGVRYAINSQYGVEGRALFGEGFAASFRGESKWDRFGWKVKPLAGLELSFLSEVGKDKRSGQALGAFVGGEIPVAGALTMQMDFGPALVRLDKTEWKEENWAYANVVNFAIKYYFGINIR